MGLHKFNRILQFFNLLILRLNFGLRIIEAFSIIRYQEHINEKREYQQVKNNFLLHTTGKLLDYHRPGLCLVAMRLALHRGNQDGGLYG